jgi:AraC family transcriptional regulator
VREAAGFSLSHRAADRSRRIELHTHDEAHFILLFDGHYLSSAHRAAHLRGGPALVYNPPGTTHRDRFDGGRGTFFALSISRARMDQVTSAVPLTGDATRVHPRRAIAIAQRLARECRCWGRASSLMAEGLCLELLAEVALRLDDVPRARRGAPAWLTAAREVLHDRCADDLAISDVARAAGVHPIHLARTFRRFFGCAPAEYLRLCRVERAAALLRDTTRPLVEVALGCGFADQSHFAKSFRRAYAVPPGEYRRRVRG